MTLRVRLSGHPELERNGRPIQVDTRKAIALLAYLVVKRETQGRDHLAALLWPESDQTRARASLRRTLSSLRKATGDGVIEASRDEIGLVQDPDVRVDMWQFDELLNTVERHEHDQSGTCRDCVVRLQDAEALYRGNFMEGFSLKDSYEFDEWQYFERDRLTRRYSATLEQLVEWKMKANDDQAAISYGQKWIALDHLHEAAHQHMMRLYALRGERASALRQYRMCTRVLDEELGVQPLPETQELYRQIREGEGLHWDRPPARIDDTELADDQPAPFPELIGRQYEMDQLHKALQVCEKGGQLVALVGEAGIGKTHLAQEFVSQARATGCAVIACRGYRWEDNRPYATIVEGLRTALNHPGSEHKLAQIPVHWLSEAARLLPELLSMSNEAQASPYLEGPGAQGRVFEALRKVILALVAGTSAGILWIDDLNWVDQATLDFISYLARGLPEERLLLILCWREMDDRQTRVLEAILNEAEREKRGLTLPLGRLTLEEVIRLTENLPDAPATFHQDLFMFSEGLPLYVVEYLSLPKVLERFQTGEWPIPESVLELERARLSALSETSRQIASTAAVLGRSFDLDTLRISSGRTESEVVTGLEQLIGHRLLNESTIDDRLVYDFSHGALREAAYRDISMARRRLLHKRVANSLLESMRREGRTDDLSAVIAHHFRMAGEDERAAAFFVRAGNSARAVYANHEALEHYRTALALGHPDRQQLLEAIGDLLTLQGDYQDAISSYESAAARAEAMDMARLEHKLGNLHQRSGDWELAVTYYHSALESAFDEDDRLRAAILSDLAYCIHRGGDLSYAIELGDRALSLAIAGGHRGEKAKASNVLGILARGNENLDQARALLEDALEITSGDMELAPAHIAALNNLAFIHRDSGELEPAVERTNEALELCRKLGDRHREAALLNNLADLYHQLGLESESIDHLRQAVVIFSEVGTDQETYLPDIWMLADW